MSRLIKSEILTGAFIAYFALSIVAQTSTSPATAAQAGTTGPQANPGAAAGTAAASGTAAAAGTATAPAQPKAWTLGIARFTLARAGDAPTSLQDSLPRLLASGLRVLPLRHSPEAAAREIAARDVLRAHFAAGDDLAAKLDARALSFFDPGSDPNARGDALRAAEKAVAASKQKLADLDAAKSAPPALPTDLQTKLWDNHAKGLLIDSPTGGRLQAAKAAGVDLLVTGTIALQSGYAIIQVRGFDAILEREVFSWKAYCAADDPAPAAREIQDKIERWVAGREYSRLSLNLQPSSAELSLDGQVFTGGTPVFYSYEPKSLDIEASASGYKTKSIKVELALGDHKSIDLELEPAVTGAVVVHSQPEDAAVSLDSVPVGRAPVSIVLNGSRGIATLSAEGREPESIVLPASGESELDVPLLPVDGLGPSGRITAAKTSFYQSLGWFVLSIPAATLSAELYRGYYEGYNRAYSDYGTIDNRLYVSSGVAQTLEYVSIAAAVVAATFMVIRLVKYLGAAH